MKIKKLLFAAVFTAFSLFSLSAETHELPFIKGMAESSDYKHKQVALSEIDTLISEGSLSDSKMKGIVDVLNYLACEGIVNLRYESLRVENDNIMIRNEAVRLLGHTAHTDAVDSLMTVLQNDTSTLILSTAVLSCAQLGMTHDRMDVLFTRILKGQKACYRDDSLIYSTLHAVRALTALHGSTFWSSDLRVALVDVAVPSGGYSRNTRLLAKDVLGEL